MASSSQPRRFGVLGSGEVGQALAKGLAANGYEARIGSRAPAKLAKFSKSRGIHSGTFQEVAAWGAPAGLSVLGPAAREVIELAGPATLRGKLVIDAPNPISAEPPVDGV